MCFFDRVRWKMMKEGRQQPRAGLPAARTKERPAPPQKKKTTTHKCTDRGRDGGLEERLGDAGDEPAEALLLVLFLGEVVVRPAVAARPHHGESLAGAYGFVRGGCMVFQDRQCPWWWGGVLYGVCFITVYVCGGGAVVLDGCVLVVAVIRISVDGSCLAG